MIRACLLLLLLLPAAAGAQTGVPQPPVPASPAPPAAPAHPHTAAKPAKPKPTPVVLAPANPHAQRPAAPVPPAPATPPPEPPPAVAADKGSVTGLPLPRWVALRSEDVNMRVGPGTRFPIIWQYHRRDLPVQVLREVEVWRLIVDQDGIKGWVHQATLVGHRSFVVNIAEAVMRRAAEADAAPVARLRLGVVGRIRACAAGAAWCEVQVGEYRGFVQRDQMWGMSPGEAVN